MFCNVSLSFCKTMYFNVEKHIWIWLHTFKNLFNIQVQLNILHVVIFRSYCRYWLFTFIKQTIKKDEEKIFLVRKMNR